MDGDCPRCSVSRAGVPGVLAGKCLAIASGSIAGRSITGVRA